MLKFKEKIFITAIAILLLSASIVRAEIALSFSSNCASPVGFNGPFAIACDSSGYYYVVDTLNNRIQKFDSNWTFIKQWGQYGYWNGEFMYPRGIAIDDTGNVYVTGAFKCCIQKFNSNGDFILKSNDANTYAWKLNLQNGIAVDKSGKVYVTDYLNKRILIFDSNLTFISKMDIESSPGGQFDEICGIAVDNNGNIYVGDLKNKCIQKFSSNGTFIKKWGSYGTDIGQFNFQSNLAASIALDDNGNIYITDADNNCFQVFDREGNFKAKFGIKGAGSGQFNSPRGLTVSADGFIYIMDECNNRVQKISPGIASLQMYQIIKYLKNNNYVFDTHPTDNSLCGEDIMYMNSSDYCIYQYKNGTWTKVFK